MRFRRYTNRAKKIFAGLLCCLAFSLAAGCAPEGIDTYDKAVKELENGDYGTAMKKFNESVKEDGRLSENYRGQGIVYLKLGDYRHAATLFQMALDSMEFENTDFETDTRLYLALAQKENGDMAAAEANYALLAEGEAAPYAKVYLGGIKLLQNDTEAAAQLFAEAEGEEQSFALYLLIYEAYKDVHLEGKGVASLEKAAALPCRTAEDYIDLSRVCVYLEDMPGAESALMQAAGLGNNEAVLMLGRLYLDNGRTDAAKEVYLQARNEGREIALCTNGLAVCACEEGDFEKALFYIDEGLKCADPKADESLLFNEIVIYERMNDFETAGQKAAAFLKKYPQNAEIKRELKFLDPRNER